MLNLIIFFFAVTGSINLPHSSYRKKNLSTDQHQAKDFEYIVTLLDTFTNRYWASTFIRTKNTLSFLIFFFFFSHIERPRNHRAIIHKSNQKFCILTVTAIEIIAALKL